MGVASAAELDAVAVVQGQQKVISNNRSCNHPQHGSTFAELETAALYPTSFPGPVYFFNFGKLLLWPRRWAALPQALTL